MYDYKGKIQNYFKDTWSSLGTLVFWLIAGSVTGAVVGLVGVGFHYAIASLTGIRNEHNSVIFLLPLGGLLVVWLYKAAGFEKDKGTNAVILAVRENEELPFRRAVLIFVSTVITHFLGGSSGREGAALQIGGSLAASGSRLIKQGEKQSKMFVMCGMSACFSALFGTPVTAAIFSIEVISVGIMHYSAIIPCVVSAITAYEISTGLGVVPTSFSIRMVPELHEITILKVIPFAVACALASRFFCFIIHRIKHIMQGYIPNPYIRVLTGSAIIIALTLAVGDQRFNGAGGDIITQSFSVKMAFYYWILKLLFTAVTLGCGFKGGEIVPAFFVGATFGSFASEFFGINYSFGAGLGLIALFCGATNCPVASLLMSIELFGVEAIPYFALICGIAYLVSGDTGLYGEQKIMYSRKMPVFINRTLRNKKTEQPSQNVQSDNNKTSES